jgi:hypothetical protein
MASVESDREACIRGAVQGCLRIENITDEDLRDATMGDILMLLSAVQRPPVMRALAIESMQQVYSIILSQLPDDERVALFNELESTIDTLKTSEPVQEDFVRMDAFNLMKPSFCAAYAESTQLYASNVLAFFTSVVFPRTLSVDASSPLLARSHIMDPYPERMTLVKCLGAHIRSLSTFAGDNRVSTLAILQSNEKLSFAKTFLVDTPPFSKPWKTTAVMRDLRNGKFVTRKLESEIPEKLAPGPVQEVGKHPLEKTERSAEKEIPSVQPISAAAAPRSPTIPELEPSIVVPPSQRTEIPVLSPKYATLVERLFQTIADKTNAQNSAGESAVVLRVLQICWIQIIQALSRLARDDAEDRMAIARKFVQQTVPALRDLPRGFDHLLAMVADEFVTRQLMAWRKPAARPNTAEEFVPALMFSACCLLGDDANGSSPAGAKKGVLTTLLYMLLNMSVLQSAGYLDYDKQTNLCGTISWIYEKRPDLLYNVIAQNIIVLYMLAVSGDDDWLIKQLTS